MKTFKRNIPNFITLLNLVSGLIGLIFILKYNKLLSGLYFMFLSMFFDLLDGLSARLLKAQSDIGKELDSLADLVSFGLLPAMLVFATIDAMPATEIGMLRNLKYLTVLYPAFVAFRLAKFNIEPQETTVFKGLPSPIAAFAFVGLAVNSLFIEGGYFSIKVISLIVFMLILSLMMISRLSFASLKLESFRLKQNVKTYIMMFFSAIFFILLKLDALIYIFLLYIAISSISNKKTK